MKVRNWLKNNRVQWVVWPAWVIVCFLAVMYIAVPVIVWLAVLFGLEEALLSTGGGLILQALLGIGVAASLLSVPAVRKTTNRKTLGVHRPMTWADIGLGVAGYVIYFVVLLCATVVIVQLIPGYNATQAQDLGVTGLFGAERLIGFLVFAIVVPLVEEFIMRGFLYGKLRQARMPMWPAAVIVSVLFGLAHGQWNVGVDTFILSMVACYLREVTGTIWPGVVIHMVKNAVAYVLLFVVMIPR